MKIRDYSAKWGPGFSDPCLVFGSQQFFEGKEGVDRTDKLCFNHLSTTCTAWGNGALERVRACEYPLGGFESSVGAGYKQKTNFWARPQIDGNGFLGIGVRPMREVKGPDKIHHVQHLRVM